jgi:3-methyladenine DNA glycosylase AlkC
MSFQLKDMYSKAFVSQFADIWYSIYPVLDRKQLVRKIFDKDWEARELKDRMRHIAVSMHPFMPENYEHAVQLLIKLIDVLRASGENEQSFEYMFIPEYVALFGQDNAPVSMWSMEFINEYTSCEFAVRPFLINEQDFVFKYLYKWMCHDSEYVRRFSSEGCRPRLPWGLAVPALKQYPEPILPILEELRNDQSEFVRRSVANNMNDISKDHPELIIGLTKKWIGDNANTDRLLKHANRTLLKQGNPEVMQLFGFAPPEFIEISEVLVPETVAIGDVMPISFMLNNKQDISQLVRLEYAIYFLRGDGSQWRKVFKISEKSYAAFESRAITKNHSFRKITTRRFYTGQHHLTLIINGVELEKHAFVLTD